jgi:hypothetical protein
MTAYLWRTKKAAEQDMSISLPFHTIHKTHVKLDSATGELTVGSLPEWKIGKEKKNIK